MTNHPPKAQDYLKDEHLSAETRKYLQTLNAADSPVESLSIPQARKILEDIQSGIVTDLSGIEESEQIITAGDYHLRLNLVRPAGKTEKLPAFLFIHGGGWVLGDYPTHRRLVRDLVAASGFVCIFINYTPSPEAKFPQTIDEIFAATQWIATHGEELRTDTTRLAIVGNSAGGNMSIVTNLLAKEYGGPAIRLQILLWPVTDASTDWESYRLYGKQRFLTSSLMQWMFSQYTTEKEDRSNPHLSPLQSSIEELRGLPPTLIAVAENDILRDQGEALGRRLGEAGVDATTVRFNGVIHDWGMLNGFAGLPQTHTLILLCAAMLKKYLK